LLRRLIDPNKADLRATPKDERDLAIAAEHGRVLAFDNLTYLSDSLSNALCRLATGGGFATRELFTDEGEVIFDSQRPVILNGIAEVVTKSDLLDRSILIYLPQIDRKKRKLDRVIDRDFAKAQPRILGALLDAVSKGLKRLKDGVTLDELPRMADFAEWATACESGLGLTEGQFLKAYKSNQEKANGLAIETSPVAQEIITFIVNTHPVNVVNIVNIFHL
jgi:putative DNA primase/helicase